MDAISSKRAPPSAGCLSQLTTLPGTSSITLPDHCFQNAETVQTFLTAWSNVMVAKEQSRASVVASTCGLLSTKAKAKAQTDCTKAQCAAEIMTNRTTENAKTARTAQECETTRECRRLQRDEVVQRLQRNPWQNFTNACTVALGLSTVSKAARSTFTFPARGIRMALIILVVVLLSRHSMFRKLLLRFMFWRYPRFSRTPGCSVSYDGRKASFNKNAEVQVLPPRHLQSPLALNFRGARFQVGLTDGEQYWLVDAPDNGRIRILNSMETCVNVGSPELWGVLLDIEQKTVYLTIEGRVNRLCFSRDEVTSNVIWPVVRGFAGQEIELVW